MRRFLLLALVGCGGASVTIPDSGPDSSTPVPDATMPPVDAAMDVVGPCPRSCSNDLHDVVDCNGNVVQTCGADQACDPGGMCIAACDATRAHKSSIGCDYYAVNPGHFPMLTGHCFAAFVTNVWKTDLTISVSYGSQQLNVANFARIPTGSGNAITYASLPNDKLPPGKVAVLFLADVGAAAKCPITPGISIETASPNTTMMSGFRITTSLPVTAFDVYPYGAKVAYSGSGTMLLPVSSWGTGHMGVHSYARSTQHTGDHLFLQIVSDEDNNQVEITPTSAIVGGNGVSPAPANQPKIYMLNKGNVLQLLQDTPLDGSPIISTKPIGLFGGNSCMNIETDMIACEGSHQQMPPVNAMGSEYVAVRHKDRASAPEVPPWRLMGIVDGTQLTYFPSVPMGAPMTLNRKQLVKFNASGPFVVKSQDTQHPFYLSAHMMGAQAPNSGGVGDPEQVNVIPPKQWLNDYTFMTDPTMATTSLVVIRGKANDNTYKDVKVDCMSAPVAGWQMIQGTDYQSAIVDLRTNGSAVGSCDNGVHNVQSTSPFGLTVWGWDAYVSYAYPGGASVRNITTMPPINDK